MVSFLFVIYKKKIFYEAHRQEITTRIFDVRIA